MPAVDTQHVLAAGDPLVERVEPSSTRVAELEVAGQLADPVVAVLDGGGRVRRLHLEPVEGLLHLVEHEVGGAHADGTDGEEGDQHRRHAADVDGEAVDDRVEQHRGRHRGRPPTRWAGAPRRTPA